MASCFAGHGGRATRNVRSKTGDNCVVRSAAIHFFIAQQAILPFG
jgi:hypothetical protein